MKIPSINTHAMDEETETKASSKPHSRSQSKMDMNHWRPGIRGILSNVFLIVKCITPQALLYMRAIYEFKLKVYWYLMNIYEIIILKASEGWQFPGLQGPWQEKGEKNSTLQFPVILWLSWLAASHQILPIFIIWVLKCSLHHYLQ